MHFKLKKTNLLQDILRNYSQKQFIVNSLFLSSKTILFAFISCLIILIHSLQKVYCIPKYLTFFSYSNMLVQTWTKYYSSIQNMINLMNHKQTMILLRQFTGQNDLFKKQLHKSIEHRAKTLAKLF